MGFLKKHKQALTIIVIVVILFVAYSLFFAGGTEEGFLSRESATGGESPEVGQELLVLLLEVRSIELDDRIFEDPLFVNLRDFSQSVPDQPVGRNNPFSAIGNDRALEPEPEPEPQAGGEDQVSSGEDRDDGEPNPFGSVDGE